MWTPCALASEGGAYSGAILRIVEAQHRISTNRLAASAADQALLEHLADAVKPPLPEGARHLPWLLASPFRYGLGRPSRFRAADVLPGIFYASEAIETAVTEAAYWRLLGFSRSPGFQRPRSPTPMSAFAVDIATDRLLDLTRGAFAEPAGQWTHPTDYGPTQQIAVAARRAGIMAIRAPSARHGEGINVSVLDPAALSPPPRAHSSWAFLATAQGLLVTREMSDQAFRFTPEEFGIG